MIRYRLFLMFDALLMVLPRSWRKALFLFLASLSYHLAPRRNRIIRRAMEALGHPVARLIRISIGGLELGTLKPGEYRRLRRREIENLLTARRKKA